jgi:hypothetical protein
MFCTCGTYLSLLDKTFSIFGIPKELKSDNGPPFNSQEFRKFADNMRFKHRKITPLWPRANKECERFMKTIGKAIHTAHTEHSSWKQEIYTFLRWLDTMFVLKMCRHFKLSVFVFLPYRSVSG